MLFNRVLTTDGQVLIDLTNLSVTADTLLAGITAIDRYGEHITGTFNIPQLQEKTVTSNGVVLPDSGYDGMSSVYVDVPIPEGYIIPEGNLNITENGIFNVVEYASAVVNVKSPPDIIPIIIEGANVINETLIIATV